jgi:hypothetical protein
MRQKTERRATSETDGVPVGRLLKKSHQAPVCGQGQEQCQGIAPSFRRILHHQEGGRHEQHGRPLFDTTTLGGNGADDEHGQRSRDNRQKAINQWMLIDSQPGNVGGVEHVIVVTSQSRHDLPGGGDLVGPLNRPNLVQPQVAEAGPDAEDTGRSRDGDSDRDGCRQTQAITIRQQHVWPDPRRRKMKNYSNVGLPVRVGISFTGRVRIGAIATTILEAGHTRLPDDDKKRPANQMLAGRDSIFSVVG